MRHASSTSREYPFLYAILSALAAALSLYFMGRGAFAGATAAVVVGGTGIAALTALAVCLRPWPIRARRGLDALGALGLFAALAAAVAGSGWVLVLAVLAALAVDAGRLRTRAEATLPRRSG